MKKSVKSPFARRSSILTLNFFVPTISIFLLMLLASSAAFSQINRNLRPEVYEHVIKRNSPVEVKTIEDGKVKETRTTPIKDLKLADGSKTVVPYQKNIEIMDTASFRRAKLIPEFNGVREDIKIIPELHIERKGTQTESYSIAFTTVRPFRYDHVLKTFKATLGFFLSSPDTNSHGKEIEPVNLAVVSEAVNIITPDHLKIPHVFTPFSNVDLVANSVIDSAQVKVITISNPDGYKTYLKVEPALEIWTNKLSLQGYGIQTMPITVRFIGSSSTDSVSVNFSASAGSVSPGSMFVTYNKPSTIYLRSEGKGVAILSAASSNSKSNEITFTYTFPWSFLLFSIVGGLIGGLAKHYFASDKKNFPVKPIIGGILIGFMVAVAYYFLGINLIGLSLSAGFNEMAVLGLSALGAYFGITVSPKPTK